MSVERHLQAIERAVAAIREERGEERVVLRSRDGWTREVCVAPGVYDVYVQQPLSMEECARLWDEPITSMPPPPPLRRRRFADTGRRTLAGYRVLEER